MNVCGTILPRTWLNIQRNHLAANQEIHQEDSSRSAQPRGATMEEYKSLLGIYTCCAANESLFAAPMRARASPRALHSPAGAWTWDLGAVGVCGTIDVKKSTTKQPRGAGRSGCVVRSLLKTGVLLGATCVAPRSRDAIFLYPRSSLELHSSISETP